MRWIYRWAIIVALSFWSAETVFEMTHKHAVSTLLALAIAFLGIYGPIWKSLNVRVGLPVAIVLGTLTMWAFGWQSASAGALPLWFLAYGTIYHPESRQVSLDEFPDNLHVLLNLLFAIMLTGLAGFGTAALGDWRTIVLVFCFLLYYYSFARVERKAGLVAMTAVLMIFVRYPHAAAVCAVIVYFVAGVFAWYSENEHPIVISM